VRARLEVIAITEVGIYCRVTDRDCVLNFVAEGDLRLTTATVGFLLAGAFGLAITSGLAWRFARRSSPIPSGFPRSCGLTFLLPLALSALGGLPASLTTRSGLPLFSLLCSQRLYLR
jgi:hypothetical protein